MSDHDASIQRWAEFRRENADLRAKLHASEAEVARLHRQDGELIRLRVIAREERARANRRFTRHQKLGAES